MAQRTMTVLTCDLHDKEVEAVESVSFSVRGTSYDVDLCDSHLKKFNDGLAAFVAAARTSGRKPAARTRRAGGRRRAAAAASGSETQAIREWARNNGHTVSAKGRIPAGIVAEYRAQI